MNEEEILDLLQAFKDGSISGEAVVEKIKKVPYEDIGFAKLDHHRTMRQGFPEVVFCQGKTIAQIVEIMQRLAKESQSNILASRATPEMYEAVFCKLPEAEYNELARVIFLKRQQKPIDQTRSILILTAGTSDIPVAEEAKMTAELMGNAVVTCYDVGVAGIHRLFAKKHLIDAANVIVVIAGMEGALASVVGGLTDKPVIAVPTSIGYGASFQGLAALLSMLNSCAAGVAVMNIDNGFGAGKLASTINHMR